MDREVILTEEGGQVSFRDVIDGSPSFRNLLLRYVHTLIIQVGHTALSNGRAKIETRPLLLVKCKCADGTEASIILQNDWHVRVLGPGGIVHNITELKAGDVVLGDGAACSRHVGMAVDEYCLEQ